MRALWRDERDAGDRCMLQLHVCAVSCWNVTPTINTNMIIKNKRQTSARVDYKLASQLQITSGIDDRETLFTSSEKRRLAVAVIELVSEWVNESTLAGITSQLVCGSSVFFFSFFLLPLLRRLLFHFCRHRPSTLSIAKKMKKRGERETDRQGETGKKRNSRSEKEMRKPRCTIHLCLFALLFRFAIDDTV